MPSLINGKAYDYANIQLILAGVPLASPTSINYTESQEKFNNYGTGFLPHSRGRGQKEFSVSIELAMNEVEILRDSVVVQNPLSRGKLTDLAMFDIVVVFNPGDKVAIHTLKNCEFSDDGVEGSNGDGQISRTFSLICSDIYYR